MRLVARSGLFEDLPHFPGFSPDVTTCTTRHISPNIVERGRAGLATARRVGWASQHWVARNQRRTAAQVALLVLRCSVESGRVVMLVCGAMAMAPAARSFTSFSDVVKLSPYLWRLASQSQGLKRRLRFN